MTPEHREAEGRDEEADLQRISDYIRESIECEADGVPAGECFIDAVTIAKHYILALRTCRKERDEYEAAALEEIDSRDRLEGAIAKKGMKDER